MWHPRFSLRTLVVFVAIFGTTLGWHFRCRRQWDDTVNAAKNLDREGFSFSVSFKGHGVRPPTPWARWWPPRISEVFLIAEKKLPPDLIDALEHFRNAENVRLMGEGVDDETLAQIIGAETKAVCLLPLTQITPAGLNALQQSPELSWLTLSEGPLLSEGVLKMLARHKRLKTLEGCWVHAAHVAQMGTDAFPSLHRLEIEITETIANEGSVSQFAWVSSPKALQFLGLTGNSAKCLMPSLKHWPSGKRDLWLTDMDINPGDLGVLQFGAPLQTLGLEKCIVTPATLKFVLVYAPPKLHFVECDLPSVDDSIVWSERLQRLSFKDCGGAFQELEMAAAKRHKATSTPGAPDG